jgi:esterase/lipase
MNRRIASGCLGVVACLAIVFVAGPRVRVDSNVGAVSLPADLDRHLGRSEARFPNLVPGTEKTIVWARSDRSRTPVSIVYLHGFSATRRETAPLSERIADSLDANLYYARLTGHGLGGSSLAAATVNDWLFDASEALEIGRRLGEIVVVIGTSTGGTLATWLAQRPGAHDMCLVLLSPNFGPADGTAEVLAWPWSRHFVRWLVGADYEWTPANEDHRRYWTSRYPSTALVTMMSLVRHVRGLDLGRVSAPVLVVYSRNDRVVSGRAIERSAGAFGSSIKRVERITTNINAENHVLAGDILAPGNTDSLAALILGFVRSVVASSSPVQPAARPIGG